MHRPLEHPLTIETIVHQQQAIQPSQLTLEYHHKTNKENGSTKAIFVQNSTVVIIIEFINPRDINTSDLTNQAYSIAIPLLVLHQKADNTVDEYELDIKCYQSISKNI
jgi:hypothetical protein